MGRFQRRTHRVEKKKLFSVQIQCFGRHAKQLVHRTMTGLFVWKFHAIDKKGYSRTHANFTWIITETKPLRPKTKLLTNRNCAVNIRESSPRYSSSNSPLNVLGVSHIMPLRLLVPVVHDSHGGHVVQQFPGRKHPQVLARVRAAIAVAGVDRVLFKLRYEACRRGLKWSWAQFILDFIKALLSKIYIMTKKPFNYVFSSLQYFLFIDGCCCLFWVSILISFIRTTDTFW